MSEPVSVINCVHNVAWVLRSDYDALAAEVKRLKEDMAGLLRNYGDLEKQTNRYMRALQAIAEDRDTPGIMAREALAGMEPPK